MVEIVEYILLLLSMGINALLVMYIAHEEDVKDNNRQNKICPFNGQKCSKIEQHNQNKFN